MKKKTFAGVVTPVVLAGALLATIAFSADAATTTPAAAQAIAPANTVNGKSVVDRSLSEVDLYGPFVQSMRTTFDNTVSSYSVKDGSLGLVDFSAAAKAGLKGAKGDTGATGPKGEPGTSAIVSVTAATSITNRPDSGSAGTWALDTLSRNFTITKHGAVDANNCGPAATECYLYYASGTDTGTFNTVDGWKSPGAGVDGNGNVSGTVSGAIKGQFYATSATPDPSLVDATVDGAAHPTARWAAMFFPASVTVTDTDLRDWGWTYNAGAVCNTWVNAKAGNSGDVTGVNAC